MYYNIYQQEKQRNHSRDQRKASRVIRALAGIGEPSNPSNNEALLRLHCACRVAARFTHNIDAMDTRHRALS